jgi:hypothetical protein
MYPNLFTFKENTTHWHNKVNEWIEEQIAASSNPTFIMDIEVN